MNPHTGEIEYMTEEELTLRRMKERWLEIDPANMTRKQRRAMKVSLNDHTSTLGKIATAERSKYQRHVGAKELARIAKRSPGILSQNSFIEPMVGEHPRA